VSMVSTNRYRVKRAAPVLADVMDAFFDVPTEHR
jgi:hypothetical protein